MNIAVDSQNIDLPLQYADIVNMHDDLVYADSEDELGELNQAEETVCERLSKHLEDKEKLSQYIPSPPTQLMLLLKEAEQEHTNFDKIQKIIKKDLGLLGEIVRISNSPLYRPRSGEITSIEKAISMLGIQGVMEIASQLLLRKVVDMGNTEYSNFSQFLWSHCLKSAEACRFLGETEDGFTNYLLGLIHSIGRVVILTSYVSLSGGKKIDKINNMKVIRHVSLEQTPWISSLVAEEWELPKIYLDTLHEFESMSTCLLLGQEFDMKLASTRILHAGSISAEIHTLVENSKLEHSSGLTILNGFGFVEEQSATLFEKFELLNSS
ncbi:MAG: HDOD domain-containing protein [Pseudomonadales bacterium]|nr:HDOD domain-containing protein [Pseudomonadales bacterium]